MVRNFRNFSFILSVNKNESQKNASEKEILFAQRNRKMKLEVL